MRACIHVHVSVSACVWHSVLCTFDYIIVLNYYISQVNVNQSIRRSVNGEIQINHKISTRVDIIIIIRYYFDAAHPNSIRSWKENKSCNLLIVAIFKGCGEKMNSTCYYHTMICLCVCECRVSLAVPSLDCIVVASTTSEVSGSLICMHTVAVSPSVIV